MGIAEQHLEMLFISNAERGKGVGKELLQYGIEQYSVNDLAVNEQNPLAKGFYEHMGFTVYKRTELDEQGNPYPLLYMKRAGLFKGEKWLKWTIELQSLAQTGLTYTKDVYDRERYKRIREISAEMLAEKTDFSIEKVKNLFCNETGYQTPKLDTRAAIFKDNKILLVHENTGTWALPGGWCDVLESVKSNTEKEVREETGLNVKAVKIISIQDRNKHNKPVYAYEVCKIFVLCEVINGSLLKT